MIAAVTFHLTAIVTLPIGVISITRNKLVTYSMLLLLGVSLYVVFVQGDVDRLYGNYVTAKYASEGALVRVMMNLPPALIFLLAPRRFGMSPESTKLWRNMSLAAVACLLMLTVSSASTAIDRLALYLIPLQIVILSRVPGTLASNSRDRLLLSAGVVLYCAAIQYVWLNYAAHSNYWLPYTNYIWS